MEIKKQNTGIAYHLIISCHEIV